MIQECWSKWVPCDNLENCYNLINLRGSRNLLVLELESYYNKHKVHVEFSKSLCFYKLIDEGYSIGRLCEVEDKYGDGFIGNWTFFKITESSYLFMLFGKALPENMQHFCIITGNEFIDIFAINEPTVKLL